MRNLSVVMSKGSTAIKQQLEKRSIACEEQGTPLPAAESGNIGGQIKPNRARRVDGGL